MVNGKEDRVKEMKQWILIGILLVAGCANVTIPTACYEDTCFEIEIADDPAELSRGLMFREHLDMDKGMLFVYDEEGLYKFWMKNTLIPLDIIWMDSNGRIVFIASNVQPCGEEECIPVDPLVEASYVLEINGGLSSSLGLGVGDLIEINI